MKISPASRCLIVFPDDWLSYSPTTLNLISTLLKKNIEVCVVCVKSMHHISEIPCEIITIRIGKFTQKILTRLRLYGLYRVIRMTLRIRRLPRADITIGIDSLGALCAQLAGIRCYDFLSLEVRRDIFFKLIQRDRIRYVLIQSPERYEFLFAKRRIPVIYVQNSPILCAPVEARSTTNILRLAFFGNAIATHGIFECIDLVAADAELNLEICGLVDSTVRTRIMQSRAPNRIHIHEEYVTQADVRAYLSRFDIGLCLYNVDRADFNYQSVPSGKLFNYFSAGLPVIGTRMIGLRVIEDFGAGALIHSNSITELRRAIEGIRANYDEYSRGAARAANYFDFQKMIQPYIEKISYS